jgi:cell division protein FtsL
MAISDKPTKRRAAPPYNNDIGELFVRRFNVVSIYVAVLLIIAAAIVWSGIKTAEGVQQYHQDYKTLQDMKKQERKLQVEHQRLLIEQQTFSATPQIASRAVSELGMFSPTLKDKLIIQPGAATVLVPVVTTDSDEEESYDVGPRASTDLSPDVAEAEAGQ